MQKEKILIVEDEFITAMDIENILRKKNYDVTGFVATGRECLEMIKENRPDLILMDIQIKGDMDGVQLSQSIHEKYFIPVIYLTAHSDEASLHRAKLTEPYGFIIKPVNEKELYTTIETALHKYKTDRKIRESEIKYRTLFEQSGDAIYLRDINRKITDVNRSMTELFGYTREEFYGMDVLQLFSEKSYAEEMTEKTEKYGFIDNTEIILLKKDGTKMHCLINSSEFSGKINDSSGSPAGYQVIIRDITEQKKIEAEREKLLNDITKRARELKCLYMLTELAGKPGSSINDLLAEMARIIPEAWQYPEITSCRITYMGSLFLSERFSESPWKIDSFIFVNGENAGAVQVYYTKQCPEKYEGPFLKEERDLLNALTERLGKAAELKIAGEALKKSYAELKNLSSHLQNVREEERTTIAREIHDQLGQSLTALKIDTSWLKKRLCTASGEITEKLNSMSELIDNTVHTVRKISAELRPGILDDLGLYAAIEWQAEEVEKRTGVKCSVKCDNPEMNLSSRQSIALYRLFQEAITNTIRHAYATEAEVRLSSDNNSVKFEFYDNGRGITREEIENSRSFGIIGMKERVMSCGGTIHIEGLSDFGTKIIITMPL